LAVGNAVPKFDDERVLSAKRVSSACLEAARWCLVADGGWVAASDTSPEEYAFYTGSSFAAPQVSGALALLAEAFPNLEPHDLRIRLLASADNSFFAFDDEQELAPGYWHGYNEEFGHGFLDVRAALLPIGTPVVQMTDETAIALDEPVLVSGSAIGDAVATELSKHQVLITDSFSGDFTVGAESLTASAFPAPLAPQRLAYAMAEQLSDTRSTDFFSKSELLDLFPSVNLEFGVSSGGPKLQLMMPDKASGFTNVGFAMAQQWDAPWGTSSLGVSLLRDDSGLLGLTSGGSGGAIAGAIDLGLLAPLQGQGYLSLRGQVGISAAGENSLVNMPTLGFDSYSVEVGKRGAFFNNDRLSLGLSIPTAIRSGSVDVALPVARAGTGDLIYQDLNIDLSPEHREHNLSLRYQANLGMGWEFLAEVVHAENRGHRKGQTDTGALIALKVEF
jgi:hypothetical protein